MEALSDIFRLLKIAKKRFLKGKEIEVLYNWLENTDIDKELEDYIVTSLPYRPSIPFICILKNIFGDIKELKSNTKWKYDGFSYEKRTSKGNRGSKEFKQILKLNKNSNNYITVYYSKGIQEMTISNQYDEEKMFQRRLYISSKCNNYTIIQYHYINRKKSYNSQKFDTAYNFKNDFCLNFSSNTRIGFNCYTNKIIDISPRYSDIKGKDPILIILKEEVRSKVNPKVYFGSFEIKGSFLNPFTIKAKIPEVKHPIIINIKVFIDNCYFIKNKSLYFEYKNCEQKETKKICASKNDDKSFTNILYSDNDFESIVSLSIDNNDKSIDNNEIFNLLNEHSAENLTEEIYDKVKLIQKVVRGWIKRKNYSLLKRTAITLQKKFKCKI